MLLTGLMGGAIATHLRLDHPLFSHTLFGVYLGLLSWGGLWLRDDQRRYCRSCAPSAWSQTTVIRSGERLLLDTAC